MDILERMPWMAQNAVFQRLSEIADVASLNKEERVKYDAYRNTIAVMEGQYMEGEQKGRVKGRAEGITEVAHKMKSRGMAIEDIAEMTGLSPEDIIKL